VESLNFVTGFAVGKLFFSKSKSNSMCFCLVCLL